MSKLTSDALSVLLLVLIVLAVGVGCGYAVGHAVHCQRSEAIR